jgi:hypothetical protein
MLFFCRRKALFTVYSAWLCVALAIGTSARAADLAVQVNDKGVPLISVPKVPLLSLVNSRL